MSNRCSTFRNNIMVSALAAVLSVFFIDVALAGDAVILSPRSTVKTSFEAYSNQFESHMPLAKEDDYTLLGSLWSKVMDENQFLNWNTGKLFEEGAYSSPGVLEYELYKGRFHDIYHIREEMAEKYLIKTGQKLMMQTRIAGEIDRWGKKVSRHLQMRYLKPGENEPPRLYLPGREVVPSDDVENAYEIIFSAHLFNHLPGMTVGCSMEVNSSVYGLRSNLEFLPVDRELGLEVTSRHLNTFMGGRTSLEIVGNEKEASAMIKISFGL